MFYKNVEDELIHSREDAVILEKYRSCVQKIMKDKDSGGFPDPERLVECFDTPVTIVEYSKEQWMRVLQYKQEILSYASLSLNPVS